MKYTTSRLLSFFTLSSIEYEVMLVALLTLGSFLLRTYALDVLPKGFHGDEAQTGLEARRILLDGSIGFWSPSALGQAALPFYWTAFMYKTLGDTIFTTRLSFAILNVFWTPFFYFAVRLLFSRKTAVIATFFLVTNATSLAFSRRADFIAVNFFFFPAIYFFLQFLRSNRKKYSVAAGIFIGLTHHIYAGYWITSLAFLSFIILELTIKKGAFLKRYGKNLLFLFVFYLLFASPMFIFAYQHPDLFFSRTKMVSIFLQNYDTSKIIQLVMENIKKTIFMFNIASDPDYWNSFSTKPVFEIFSGILFLIGLLTGLKHLNKRSYRFIYVFFLIFLSGSFFTIDSPSFRRSQGSIYIAFIFIGLGATFIIDFFHKNLQRVRIAAYAIGILIIGLIGFYNIYDYFFYRASSPQTRYILADRLVEGTAFLKQIPDPKYIYFFSSCCTIHHETIRYLLPKLQGEDRSSEFGKYSLQRTHKGREVFLFFDKYQGLISKVQQLYPGGKVFVSKDSANNILFSAYYF